MDKRWKKERNEKKKENKVTKAEKKNVKGMKVKCTRKREGDNEIITTNIQDIRISCSL
jgi:hypothetical protein